MRGPQTSRPRPNGRGRRIRSQERVRSANLVLAAQGNTDAPERAANCATPGAATRRGPRGPSGVNPTCWPARNALTSARNPAAPPREEDPATTLIPKFSTAIAINLPSRWRLASTVAGRLEPARSQKTGIDGNVSCQNTTMQGLSPCPKRLS
jgi:hypothetical protein